MEPPSRRAKKKDNEREALDITTVLLFFGGESVPTGNGWCKMRCPFHGERNASSTVNVEEDAFICYSCGIKGDTISLIRRHLDLSYRDACLKYEEITGVSVLKQGNGRNYGEAKAVESKSYETGSWLAQRLRKN